MIALFDLDDTLLDGDSNHLWGQFLVAQGVLDGAEYSREQARFDAAYHAGTIDFSAYLAFTLRPLRNRRAAELRAWQQEFTANHAARHVFPQALELIDSHRERGHTLIMVTATNRFFVEPFARVLQMDALLASDLEQRDGRYTGRHAGEPCYREGKLTRFRHWLASERCAEQESWFYSDSHNDLPLLHHVDHPTVVNPDTILRGIAAQQGWPILQFRTSD